MHGPELVRGGAVRLRGPRHQEGRRTEGCGQRSPKLRDEVVRFEIGRRTRPEVRLFPDAAALSYQYAFGGLGIRAEANVEVFV